MSQITKVQQSPSPQPFIGYNVFDGKPPITLITSDPINHELNDDGLKLFKQQLIRRSKYAV